VRDFYFLPLTSSLLLNLAGFFEVIGKREEVISKVAFRFGEKLFHYKG
jgi:hypothetical protein